MKENPRISYTLKIKGKPMTGEVLLGDFMEPKGWKALGNRLSDQLLGAVKEVAAGESKLARPPKSEPAAAPQQVDLFGEVEEPEESVAKKTFKAGDTIQFD